MTVVHSMNSRLCVGYEYSSIFYCGNYQCTHLERCVGISIHATLGLMHNVIPSNIRQFQTFWSILDKTGGWHHLLNPLNIVTSSHNFVVVCHMWHLLVFIMHLWSNSCVFALCFCLLLHNPYMILDHPKVQIYLNTSSCLHGNHNACNISIVQCSTIKVFVCSHLFPKCLNDKQ